jgi:hypothetical protein
VRLVLLAGATVEETDSLRADYDALGSEWYMGEHAGQHSIPKSMSITGIVPDSKTIQ